MNRANEPAYPLPVGRDSIANNRGGLTIREHFAGLAMNGLCANPQLIKDTAAIGVGQYREAIAVTAIGMADALIAELAKAQS